MLRVGIVGAGSMGRTHAAAYSKMPDVQIVAIGCLSSDRARSLASKHGAKYHKGGIEALLQDKEIDIIDVCTPTYLHKQHVVAAVRARKHVLCEKPIALTLEEADEMIEAAGRAGRKFMVAHCMRFWPEYQLARHIIQTGALGQPLVGRAVRIAPRKKDRDPERWRWIGEQSGATLVDLAIHDLDFLRWVFGEARLVHAEGIKSDRDAWDYVHVAIEHESGVKTFVESSDGILASLHPFTMGFKIICQDGVMEFSQRGLLEGERGSLTIYRDSGEPERVKVAQRDAYFEEIAYFVQCVRDDTEPTLASPIEAKRSLALALAARESLDTQQTIRIPRQKDVYRKEQC